MLCQCYVGGQERCSTPDFFSQANTSTRDQHPPATSLLCSLTTLTLSSCIPHRRHIYSRAIEGRLRLKELLYTYQNGILNTQPPRPCGEVGERAATTGRMSTDER